MNDRFRKLSCETWRGMSCETVALYPGEIEFLDVRPNQTYIQTVEMKNVLQSTCSFRIRPSNSDRISVEPTMLSLAPGETKRVQVKLKLQGKMVPKKKGGVPYRDTVQLKSDFFEKKFTVSFHPSGPPGGRVELATTCPHTTMHVCPCTNISSVLIYLIHQMEHATIRRTATAAPRYCCLLPTQVSTRRRQHE